MRELVGDDVEIETVHTDIGLETPFSGDRSSRRSRRPCSGTTRGRPVLPYLLSGGTDNKALSLLGIAGYGFAPLRLPEDMDFPAMFHGVDERVPLDALAFGSRVLRDLLATY